MSLQLLWLLRFLLLFVESFRGFLIVSKGSQDFYEVVLHDLRSIIGEHLEGLPSVILRPIAFPSDQELNAHIFLFDFVIQDLLDLEFSSLF